MPFKVVQTFERGKIVLACVPHQWECNGKLYWPKKHKHLKKLQKDEHSQPDQTWNLFECVVKRRNIESYQVGADEIDNMSDHSETEPDNLEDKVPSKKRRILDVPQQLYNSMAEEILMPDKQTAATTSTEPVLEVLENIENYIIIKDKQPDPPIMYVDEEPGLEKQYDLKTFKGEVKSIKDDLRILKESQNLILNNQSIMHDTQNQLLITMTAMQVQIEEFIKKSTFDKRSTELRLKPIKDLQDLQEFENSLNNAEFKEDLQRKLKVMCTRGIGQGVTSAYAIVDILFERQFFKSCSWTGGSRSKDDPTEKICFKSFSKTINFFFDIIHQFDTSFNVTDCQKFFKTVLRNAVQRCQNRQIRVSAKKCRTKSKKKDKNSSDAAIINQESERDPSIGEQFPTVQQFDAQQEVHISDEETLDLK